jgi:hypothetical protein
MPDIPQLVTAIDRRLADIAAEISALDAAKAELVAPHAGGQAPAVTSDATATRSPRRATRRAPTRPADRPKPGSRRRVSKQLELAKGAGGAVTPRRATRKRAPTVMRRPSGGAVEAATLERLLADTSAGLSANAIAKQAGAGYSRTLKLLHGLEAAGQVRRSGSRRSTVWQLITDDERIAQRTAELERLRRAPSRRRGTARAS